MKLLVCGEVPDWGSTSNLVIFIDCEKLSAKDECVQD